MSGEAQLEALLEIINTSARQAIYEYKKAGNGDDVPTIHSKTHHPLDSAVDTITLKKAVRLLEGACQQLCVSLAPPTNTIFNYITSFESASVRVIVRAKVVDTLEKYPNGLHVDELAKLVNLEKGKLSRMLRLLATKGCFTEVESNVFANNRISLGITSTSSMGAFARLVTEESCQGALVLYEALTDPAIKYRPEISPLLYALRKKGIESTFFDYITNDEDKREYFQRVMGGNVTGALSLLNQFPWNEVKTVCDVGSGKGTISIPLLEAHPHLKITDQDLPKVLAQAKDAWAKDAPAALENQQVELVPLNFLEESPVSGQDVYYLRYIVHDWADADAAIILKNVRNAMAPHSRLLIHDYVLIPPCRVPDAKSLGVDVAPEPLLPNFGDGSNRMYQMDLHVWMLLNSQERTLTESISLASTAGLKLEKVYDLGLGELGLLEFRVAA